MVYSRESAIAEKFEALVALNLLTSRMKDIYDILYLAEKEIFSLTTLREAILATFARRETLLKDRQVVFSKEFSANRDKETQWNAFQRRSRLQSYPTIAEAMTRLEAFLEPACSAAVGNNSTWCPSEWRWL